MILVESASVSLASGMYLKTKKSVDKPEGMKYSWKEVTDHFLETYTTDDVMAETEAACRRSIYRQV